MSNLESELNQLQKLGSGPQILGKIAIPEEELYIALTCLKKSVATGKINTTPSPELRDFIALIDRYEDTVLHAPMILGRSYVIQDKYKSAFKALTEHALLRRCSTELSNLSQLEKPLWKFFVIQTEAFLIGMTALKKKIAASSEPRLKEAIERSAHKQIVFAAIDEFESIILKSKSMLGKVFVPHELYLGKL